MQPAVYFLTSNNHKALYIGVTNNLVSRVWQHKQNAVAGFSKRYQTHTLVYYETFEDMYSAIAREKQLKNWKRAWKDELVSSFNPQWRDLYSEIT